MAWITPTDVNPGDAILASLYNQDVVANTNYLKAEADAVGLVLIAEDAVTTQASITFNDVFSSTYQNYVIYFTMSAHTTPADINFRLRVSGVNSTSTYYRAGFTNQESSSTLTASNQSNVNQMTLTGANTTGAFSSGVLTLFRPAEAVPTVATVLSMGQQTTFAAGMSGFLHNVGTAYDGCFLYSSSGTLTGSVRIYGLKDA